MEDEVRIVRDAIGSEDDTESPLPVANVPLPKALQSELDERHRELRPEDVSPGRRGSQQILRAYAEPEVSEAPLGEAELREQEWRARKKHVFILTSAGRPVFTRYGDETDFAELFGVLQILSSMVSVQTQRTSEGEVTPDSLRRVTLGNSHAIYFLAEGELLYCMVTRTRESPAHCVRQLQLIHNQLLAVLPTVSAVLERSPSYDVRRMFNHGDINVMRALIRRLNNEPGFMFRCLQPLHLPDAIRDEINKMLQSHRGGEEHLWSLLLYGSHVVSFVAPREHMLHADDLLLVINFAQVLSNAPGESCAPICLPRFNTSGYLWAFAARVEEVRNRIQLENLSISNPNFASSPSLMSPRAVTAAEGPKLVLVQLATVQEAFLPLRDAATQLVEGFSSRGADYERDIEQNAASTPIPIDINALGPECAGLQFFMFISSSAQLVTSALPPTLINSRAERKALLRHFLKARDVAHRSKAKDPLLIYGCTGYTLAVALSPVGPNIGGADYRNTELYLSFLPSISREAIPACVAAVLRFLKSRESQSFMTKAVYWP